MSDDLRNTLLAFIGTGLLGWFAVVTRRVISMLTNIDRHVIPHFAPGHDEHGRETYEHTIPYRVDQLVEENKAVREELREHMRVEEEQYEHDNIHRADREKKVDEVYEMLKAGNVEIRRDAP